MLKNPIGIADDVDRSGRVYPMEDIPEPEQPSDNDLSDEVIRKQDQKNIRQLSQKHNKVPNFQKQNFKMPSSKIVRGAGRGR